MAPIKEAGYDILLDLFTTLSELFHAKVVLLQKPYANQTSLENSKKYHYCNSVCAALDLKDNCQKLRDSSLEKAIITKEPVLGSCPAGLFSILYPLFNKEDLFGIICVTEIRVLTAPPAAILFKWNNMFDFPDDIKKSYMRIPYFREYDIKNIIRLLNDIKNLFFAAGPVINKSPRTVQDIVEYMTHHFDTHLTLQDAAALINRSPSRTSHLFLEVFNKSFKEMQSDILIEKTQEMINRNPSVQVKDLAGLLGFNDPIYFSKFFKKQTNLTISQYKKSLNQIR